MSEIYTVSAIGYQPELVATEQSAKLKLDWKLIAFFAAHLPLAYLMRESSLITTAHALIVLVIGLRTAFLRRVDQVLYVCAYIVGAEVLWRMGLASVLYEFGKYSIALIMLVALFRARQLRLRRPLLAIGFLVLLLPSSLLTFTNFEFEESRRMVSFFLSGPLAMAISVLVCSGIRLTRRELYQSFLMMIGPIIGIAIFTLISTASATALQFTGESNLITSGGFGPNQVSSVLGLGGLIALLFFLNDRISRGLKIAMFCLMILFIIQSALTFSRSGIYIMAASAVLTSFHLLRNSRAIASLLLAGIVLFLLGNFIILPYLDQFSGGKLTARFQDTNTTGRDLIVRADLDAWMEYPLFGLGPGGSEIYHGSYFRITSSHTEFSRLLSEHGTMGLLAILLLLTIAVINYWQAQSGLARGIVVAAISWSFLFMLSNAMRLAAPAFIFGLTSAWLLYDESARYYEIDPVDLETLEE